MEEIAYTAAIGGALIGLIAGMYLESRYGWFKSLTN